MPREGNVQVQFSEPMDPASISSSTVHLRKQGAGADVPSSVSYSGTTATLTPTGALDPLSLYTVTVDGSVKDLAGNPLGANDSWSFTTAALTFSFTDTTVSDFGAGSPDANTYISQTEDGELILKPAEGQEFSGGPGLPAGWSSSTWESEGGGSSASATVSGGSLHVDGALAHTEATFGPGHALEFVATFGSAKYQHVAFTDNFKSVWAMFSTRRLGNRPALHEHQLQRLDPGHPDRRARPVRRLGASLPHPMGSGPCRILHRRGPGAHRTRDVRHEPERRRQRLQLRRPDALGRLAAREPLPGLGHVHLARL